MAFGITPTGFVIKPLATILQEVNDSQLADVDAGLDQDARSVVQQINQPTVGALAELWELAQAVYNAAYPDSANDDSLDNVASITGTSRSLTTKTQVIGVSVTLSPNTPLPLGSVANLASQPNARFLTLAALPGSTVGGIFTVDFEAETAGDTVVAIGQLSEIAEPVVGWTNVTNPAAGVTGESTETDAELRVKRADELQASGSTNVNSIRADLIQVDSVVDAVVFENDTDFIDGNGIPAHGILCVLRGGGSTEIAQSIFNTKAAGIATSGAVTEAILDTQGISHDINFDAATALVFHAAITVTTDPLTFDPVGGPGAIQAAISNYVNALRIGGDVIYDVIKAAVLPVPGLPDCGVVGVVSITALVIDFNPVPASTTDLPVSLTEFATSGVTDIDVTVN